MKSNRRRIDARLPNWLYQELTRMAELREWNITEMMEAALEKGLNWYKKNWEKRKPAEAGEERHPNVLQQKYSENKEKEPTKEELDNLVEELFKQ